MQYFIEIFTPTKFHEILHHYLHYHAINTEASIYYADSHKQSEWELIH